MRSQREHLEAVCLIRWRDLRGIHEFPSLALLFHIPNGGKRSRAVAGKMKAEGVKRGVLDYCLPVPVDPFHGFFLELKAPGRTYPSTDQRDFMRDLSAQGYAVGWVRGWEAARSALIRYLRGGWKNADV